MRLRRELAEKRMLVESFAVFLGVLVVLLPLEFAYFAWQKWFVATGGKLHYPETFLDPYIPFVPEFIWPYWAYFLLLALSIYLPRDRQELARQAGGMLFIHLTGFACYLLYPSAIHRIPLTCDSWSCTATGAMYLLDPGYGVFPSLHVALSVYMAMSFFVFRHWARWGVALFAAAICASTVLVKQHYIIDVPAGVLLGYFGGKAAWALIDRYYEPVVTTVVELLPRSDGR